MSASLELPAPRVWTAENLAAYFQEPVSWVKSRRRKPDPPPKIEGIKRLRFDTQNPAFREWLERTLGSKSE